MENGPEGQFSAEKPVCFPETDWAIPALYGRVLWAGWVAAGPDFQACLVSLASGLALLVCLGRALSAGWVLTGPDFQACPVLPASGLALLVCLGRALSVGLALADADFQVGPVSPVLGLSALASPGRVLPAGPVCRVWAEVVLDGGHRVDFPDGLAGFPEDLEAYSAGDDSPNCHDNLAGWPTQSGAADTQGVADDKDSTILPNSHGCNKRGALPSSIPIRPIPKAGYQPAAPQFQFPRRN